MTEIQCNELMLYTRLNISKPRVTAAHDLQHTIDHLKSCYVRPLTIYHNINTTLCRHISIYIKIHTATSNQRGKTKNITKDKTL